MRRALVRFVASLALLLAIAAALVFWINVRDEEPLDNVATATRAAPADATTLARGAYLVRAGSCLGCHTARGGVPYAGGRPIDTPFGAVYSTNLTPDRATGIGTWSGDAFWRAMRHGRSRDGRLLYPVFPYPSYTRVTRVDTDAMHAWLMSQPPVAQPNRPHALAFPFNTQAALAVWRALYFRPTAHVDDPQQTTEWNRGAYLVDGLGHCNACHSARNALGATVGSRYLEGGLIPEQNWYAPSLASPHEAGVAEWPVEDVMRLLKTGVSDRGVVTGPMVEVVLNSTQHLSDADLRAAATYLRSLRPSRLPADAPLLAPTSAPPEGRGAALYRDHCAGCHGDSGQGAAGAYPALSGNRAVTMAPVTNLVHIVREGGFPPATAGNPRPFGMPPFATVLSDDDIALLLSFLRASWGNRAPPVTPLQVLNARSGGR